MTTLCLAPLEARISDSGVSVLFKLSTKRPNGHTSSLFLAIDGRHDIDDALGWAIRKMRVTTIEYQGNLFLTWDWETELLRAIHEFNLTAAE